MEHRVVRLEEDMVEVKTRLAVAESHINDIKEDISSIKDNTTWLLRIVIGAIVLGVLGLVLQGGM